MPKIHERVKFDNSEQYRRQLRAAREAHGLSQGDLGAKFGLKRNTYSLWESDIDNVKFGDVKRLCMILGLKIEDLCEENICREGSPEGDIKKLAVLFRMMMQSMNEEVKA